MYTKFRIKLFKPLKGRKKNSYTIVVSTNYGKVNGKFLEKLGVYMLNGSIRENYVNLSRLGYWLNKGASMSPKVQWIVSNISYGLRITSEKK